MKKIKSLFFSLSLILVVMVLFSCASRTEVKDETIYTEETIEEQREEPQRYELPESEREITSPAFQEEKKSREINYDDGSKYIGDIVNGKRHGQGAYIWADGRKYIGGFEDNRATGGWFFKTIDHKVWVYQDAEGKWIIKD
jgi:hypothetical protein